MRTFIVNRESLPPRARSTASPSSFVHVRACVESNSRACNFAKLLSKQRRLNNAADIHSKRAVKRMCGCTREVAFHPENAIHHWNSRHEKNTLRLY